jgi:hypothetical protein
VRAASPLAVAALAATLAVSSCTGPGPPPPTPEAQPQPAPPFPLLGVRLAKVSSVTLKGRPAKGPLMGPAEQIRLTLAAMYTSGFVDPAQWQAGFPTVLDAFAPETRKRAQEDLNHLTLGGSARELTSVLPTDARIVIRFLPNQNRNPVAAMADMRFLGIGTGPGYEVPIRHEGDYLMREFDGVWLIVGYDVRGHVGA